MQSHFLEQVEKEAMQRISSSEVGSFAFTVLALL